MSERDAFLAAIIANPEDDAVRLVYADWLEEHGTIAERARADFIRLQIEVERLDDADDRHQALNTESVALLERYWLEWTNGFLSDRGSAREYAKAFERGFLSFLSLDGDELSDPALDLFLACEPVTHFHLRRIDTFPATVAQ